MKTVSPLQGVLSVTPFSWVHNLLPRLGDLPIRFKGVCRVIVFGALFVLAAVNAAAAPKKTALYFSSPEESVVRATKLLKGKKWSELARYYYLEGSGVPRETLEDGSFFVRTEPPENAHPAGLWKFREPFAPGHTFLSVEPSDVPNVLNVTVGIAIDQGDGRIQRGRTTYQLRKFDQGYQLLPNASGDQTYAATGGISRIEAAERAGVNDRDESWHAVYSPALRTWFFTSAGGSPIALERVSVSNPKLPPKAPPGFEPKPWKWVRRSLPAMDVIASDEFARGKNGVTLFKRPVGGFDDLIPRLEQAAIVEVPREQLWSWLDRARERGLRVHVSVDDPSSPQAHAVLSLLPHSK